MKILIDLEIPGVPDSEFDTSFIKSMINRMAMSYDKYGRVALAYPKRVDAIASLRTRLDKYEDTGNTEYLMDVGNFAMIEFMHPRHPNAHFEPGDSNKSPGRNWIGEIDPSQRSNRIEEWVK